MLWAIMQPGRGQAGGTCMRQTRDCIRWQQPRCRIWEVRAASYYTGYHQIFFGERTVRSNETRTHVAASQRSEPKRRTTNDSFTPGGPNLAYWQFYATYDRQVSPLIWFQDRCCTWLTLIGCLCSVGAEFDTWSTQVMFCWAGLHAAPKPHPTDVAKANGKAGHFWPLMSWLAVMEIRLQWFQWHEWIQTSLTALSK
jgi:hypothetical protein